MEIERDREIPFMQMSPPSRSIVSLDNEDDLQGIAEIWESTFAFAKPMAIKAAVLLGIPDAIATKGPDALLSLEEIYEAISAKNKNVLFRILRFLVQHGIFRQEEVSIAESGRTEPRYGLTRVSKWLVRTDLSISPLLLMQLDKSLQAPWHHFHECVLDEKDTDAFTRANGKDAWRFASENSQFNDLFNEAMVSASNTWASSIVKYKEVFEKIQTLVDVGGGLGLVLSKIGAAYPRIKGINFDLPHVVARAPDYPGVKHVGGDMFEAVPNGDAIFMKMVLHDWNDEKSMKILSNCYKSLPEDGKLIIVEGVLDGGHPMGYTADLVMIAHTDGGKERTREEWYSLLNQAGFPVIKIHNMVLALSIIEAFKK